MTRLALLLACAVGAVGAVAHAQPSATYSVTFDATWSEATHPEGFPPSPHFSRLVGATHSETVALWAPGAVASDGMEAMAEHGSTSTLEAEMEALQSAGAALDAIVGGSIARSPGATSLELELTGERPLVTLVSMLAPSPDWFVGVSGLDLRRGDGWVDRLAVELFVYDAGTDSGASYTAPDADTQPRQSIMRLEGSPFAGATGPRNVGSLTFTRMATAGEPDAQGWSVGQVAPNPASRVAHIAVSVERAQTVDLEVFDGLGRRVAQTTHVVLGEARWLPVPLGGLATGVYVVRVTTGLGTATRRLWVVRPER